MNTILSGPTNEWPCHQSLALEHLPERSTTIDMPPVGHVSVAFKKAPKAKADGPQRLPLED
jgi:hypothetical protein